MNKPEDKSQKPNINEVFLAFQRFQSHSRLIGHNATEWNRIMETARRVLKADLDTMGLGEHIDWTNGGAG